MSGVIPLAARWLSVRGVVQGVGFRPFVYRLARRHGVSGWVLNDGDGVSIHVEGAEPEVESFVRELEEEAPPAARISSLQVEVLGPIGCTGFEIRESEERERPTAGISPDLPVCAACLAELFDPADPRYGYPYINCTDCGPRFSILLGLPYDRPATTMRDWPMCPECASEYHDPLDRRFHAQPVACPVCGPHYRLVSVDSLREPFDGLRAGSAARDGQLLQHPSPRWLGAGSGTEGTEDTEFGEKVGREGDAVREAVRLLKEGKILAVKGLGGYHLACDAECAPAVQALRERKFRKEKPFAVMAADLAVARTLVDLSPEVEAAMSSAARPIVLAPPRVELEGVAPDNRDLGVMLPYTPLHHLLFAAGAPRVLVMTSANRSSEPIAYRDDEALQRLDGIADAFLIGERPIARRVDDSVVRADRSGRVILRRARGYAPGSVAHLPARGTLLALGADLKNTITLVVNGDAVMSQHIGDLEHYESAEAFRETVRDLTSMYAVDWSSLTVAHDLHPQYISTGYALGHEAAERRGVQHHRAHIASVLAERNALDRRVIGVALDGTGYGDDGSIWGGEIFVGSLTEGLERVAHLRPALLPGGDAAAKYPEQAAAGFLAGLDDLPDLTAPPFGFSRRYLHARALARKNVRTFVTTSAGRLFDAVAALLGFTREVTFEGQAAIWLEQLARTATVRGSYPLPFAGGELDYRPLLDAVIRDRQSGIAASDIARAFHRGLARGLHHAIVTLAEEHGVDTVVLSGGVFQNQLLLGDLEDALAGSRIGIWINRVVPANDGGISLGQAAIAAVS